LISGTGFRETQGRGDEAGVWRLASPKSDRKRLLAWRTNHTSPQYVQRNETKCGVNAAMAVDVAAHRGQFWLLCGNPEPAELESIRSNMHKLGRVKTSDGPRRRARKQRWRLAL
jgi:hypothetical protein